MSDTPTEPAELGFPEQSTFSFIIKLWIEEAARAGVSATWRGQITHVPSGMRRYIQDFHAAIDFMSPYLVAAGVVLPKSQDPAENE